MKYKIGDKVKFKVGESIGVISEIGFGNGEGYEYEQTYKVLYDNGNVGGHSLMNESQLELISESPKIEKLDRENWALIQSVVDVVNQLVDAHNSQQEEKEECAECTPNYSDRFKEEKPKEDWEDQIKVIYSIMTLDELIKKQQERFEKFIGHQDYCDSMQHKSSVCTCEMKESKDLISSAIRETVEEVGKTLLDEFGDEMNVDNALNAHEITATVTFNQRLQRVKYLFNQILNEKE